jgi:hypothetical protein
MFRYKGDVVSLNHFVDRIYPIEPEIKDATDTDKSTSYIDLHIEIDSEDISVVTVIQIFHKCQPSHGGNRNIFEVMTSTLPKGTIVSVASLLAASFIKDILIGATN